MLYSSIHPFIHSSIRPTLNDRSIDGRISSLTHSLTHSDSSLCVLRLHVELAAVLQTCFDARKRVACARRTQIVVQHARALTRHHQPTTNQPPPPPYFCCSSTSPRISAMTYKTKSMVAPHSHELATCLYHTCGDSGAPLLSPKEEPTSSNSIEK